MSDVYHFIGLGGIGMSALARILMQNGIKVQGSDRKESPLLEELKKEGATISLGHDASKIVHATTVVYSSDIQETNEELVAAKQKKLPLLHRSDLLNFLTLDKKALFVTGTHGKTTTSSLLAWVQYVANCDPTFAVGGIMTNLETNARAGKGTYFVAEADESDGSFLKTAPFGAIVTNIDNDHMNYWKTDERLNLAFQAFCRSVKSQKHLFWCFDNERLHRINPPGFSYGFSQGADLQITSFESHDQGIFFDALFQGKLYRKIDLALFGKHNALNGAAVFGLCLQLGIPEKMIREAFQSFRGAKRRLEFKGEVHKLKVFDDYGHHPVEIQATLTALRMVAHERRLVAIFQPHRFTRVKDLFEQFPFCFQKADLVVLTDIYSAGEAPIEGVTTASLYTRMKEVLQGKLHFFPRQHLEAGVLEILKPLDVVITFGAGDITSSSHPILKGWQEKAPKIRVALLFGGRSTEHEVSMMSAETFAEALDRSVYDVHYFGITKEGKWLYGPDVFERLKKAESSESSIPLPILEKLLACDVVIPVFHGPRGEDGMIQGFLDALHLPYVGCDYYASAISMHKAWTKQVALMHHIPTASYFEVKIQEYREHPEAILQKIEENFCYPVWIKPVHLGSSVGVRQAKDPKEAKEALEHAFSYDNWVIVERHIEGRQIEFGIIGNESIRVGPPCEILNQGAFVDYKDKYGPTAMPYAIPARLTKIEEALGIELAKKMYSAVGGRGLARIDFFIDERGCFWLNEINPFPGCTKTSAFPKIWEAKGFGMDKISDELIASAFHQARRA